MPKVTLKGFILVPKSELEIVQTELINHTCLTLEETGCITFSVLQNPENPLRFDVYEEFADKESFDLHQQRVKASHWGKLAVNVERYYEVSE